MKRLNFGCGKDVKAGYVNADIAKLPGVDVHFDFEQFPYPFKNNEFGEIFCRHVLEHTKNLIATMEELHRIIKQGGLIQVICPYFAGQGAFNDPTHTRFFAYRTFEYFNENGFYSKSVFRTRKRRIFFFSSTGFMKSAWFSWPIDSVLNIAPMLYQRFFCYLLPASEIHYELEAVKETVK